MGGKPPEVHRSRFLTNLSCFQMGFYFVTTGWILYIGVCENSIMIFFSVRGENFQGIRRKNSRRFFPTLVGGPGTGGITAEIQQYREPPKAIPPKNGLP